MRKSVVSLMGGAFFGLLTLTFTACGNVSNPLEELVNSNPEVAEEVFNFLDILEVDSRLVVKFKLNDQNCTVTIKNKGNNNYEIESCEGLDPELFDFGLTEDEKQLVLTSYEEGDGEAGPARFQFFFNPQEKSFYIVNGLDEDIIFDGKVTVNKIEGTLTDECPDKTTIQLGYKENLECRAGTRNAGPSYPVEGYRLVGELVVRYKAGETWQSVIDRYANSVFGNVLWKAGDPADPNIEVSKEVSSEESEDPGQRDFELRYDEEAKVLPSHVVGMKDDVALSTEFKYPALCYYTEE